jgi:hypothetical protein
MGKYYPSWWTTSVRALQGHAAAHIHADFRLHAEIPIISLLGGRHLGVACLALALGRGRRINDRGIDQRACPKVFLSASALAAVVMFWL